MHPDARPRSLVHATALSAALLATGCTGGPAPRPVLPEVDWPPPPAAVDGARLYRVDREASQILIRVDPAGPMARLGHSHVIGGAIVDGCLIDAPGTGRDALALVIDVPAIEVDRPEWRRAAGLEPELDPGAIAGTRANVLGQRVLDAPRYPTIDVRSLAITGPDDAREARLAVRLKNRVRAITVPVRVEQQEGRLSAAAEFGFTHADFGLEPFSAAGGALSVAQPIAVRIRLVAQPLARPVAAPAGDRFAASFELADLAECR